MSRGLGCLGVVVHHLRFGVWWPLYGTLRVANAVLTAAWLQPVLSKPWTHLRLPWRGFRNPVLGNRSCCCRLVGAGAAERACLDPCGDFPVVGVSAASQVIRRLRDRHRVNRSREIADADPSWAFSSRRVCVSPVHWGETWCRESRDAVSLRVPGIWVSRTVRNAPPSEVGQRILRFRRVSSLNGRSGRMLHSHSSRQ